MPDTPSRGAGVAGNEIVRLSSLEGHWTLVQRRVALNATRYDLVWRVGSLHRRDAGLNAAGGSREAWICPRG